MPIIPKDSLDERLTKIWYAEDQKMHQPILAWLSDPSVRNVVDKFCNALLEKMTTRQLRQSIVSRTQTLKVSTSTKKASEIFFSRLPAKIQKDLSSSFVQHAIEMIFEEAGYEVENHVLSYELYCPPLVEEEEEEDDIEEEDDATALLEDLESDLDEDDDDDEDEDDEELDAEDLPEEEAKESSLINVDIEGVKADPVKVGDLYANDKGVIRQVDSLSDGRVSYTVTVGEGRVKEGSTGETSYKAFLQWSSGKVASEE